MTFVTEPASSVATNTQDARRIRSVTLVEQSSLLKLSEGRLHLVKTRMLASAHAFVFGAEKGSFVGFPGF
jgi:hypothetical protein